MRRGLKVIPVLLLLSFGSHLNPNGWGETRSQSYQEMCRKLAQLVNLRVDSDKLALLFQIGDKRVLDLIQALDDRDRAISLNAQVVIRYLGNEQGMHALFEWYKKQQTEYRVAGPVPIPLSEWDYSYIKMNCIDRPPSSWRDREVQYIYALALDGSTRASGILVQLIDKAATVVEPAFASRAIKSVAKGYQNKLVAAEQDLATAVLRNAFFIVSDDQKYTSSRLLALNAKNTKALVELHINRGPLAEEWYHVVLARHDGEWRFFSVYQVAIS